MKKKTIEICHRCLLPMPSGTCENDNCFIYLRDRVALIEKELDELWERK